MFRRSFYLAIAATLAMLWTSTQAQAYGAAHTGYTHVGPNGVQHYGSTSVSGPNGSYSGSHAGAYGAGGSAHAGSGSGATYGAGGASAGAYHYSGTSSYGAHECGGFGTTNVHGSTYSSGVYYHP